MQEELRRGGPEGKTSNATSKSPDLTNIDSPKPAGREGAWGTWDAKNWHQGFTCLLSRSSRGDRDGNLLEDLHGRLLSPNDCPEDRTCSYTMVPTRLYPERRTVILCRQSPTVNLQLLFPVPSCHRMGETAPLASLQAG